MHNCNCVTEGKKKELTKVNDNEYIHKLQTINTLNSYTYTIKMQIYEHGTACN